MAFATSSDTAPVRGSILGPAILQTAGVPTDAGLQSAGAGGPHAFGFATGRGWVGSFSDDVEQSSTVWAA